MNPSNSRYVFQVMTFIVIMSLIVSISVLSPPSKEGKSHNPATGLTTSNIVSIPAIIIATISYLSLYTSSSVINPVFFSVPVFVNAITIAMILATTIIVSGKSDQLNKSTANKLTYTLLRMSQCAIMIQFCTTAVTMYFALSGDITSRDNPYIEKFKRGTIASLVVFLPVGTIFAISYIQLARYLTDG